MWYTFSGILVRTEIIFKEVKSGWGKFSKHINVGITLDLQQSVKSILQNNVTDDDKKKVIQYAEAFKNNE